MKLTDRVLSRYADQLGAHFMGNARDGESYDAFLTRIKDEGATRPRSRRTSDCPDQHQHHDRPPRSTCPP